MPMAFRRRRRFTRRRFVRRHRRKRFTLRKTARRVRKLERTRETKTFTRYIAEPAVSITPTFYPLTNNITVGTQADERVGRKIELKGFAAKWSANSNDENSSPGSIRMVLIKQRGDFAGDLPLFGDIWEATATIGGTVDQSVRFVKDIATKQFRILWQKTVHMGTRGANESVAPLSVSGSDYRRLSGHTMFNAANDTVEGNLILCVYNFYGGGLPNLKLMTKVYYQDA